MGTSLQHLEYIWYVGALALCVGIGLSTYVLIRPEGKGAPSWKRYLASLERQLDLLASKTTPLQVVGYQILTVGLLIAAWLVLDMTLALLLVVGVVPLTFVILQSAYDRRCQTIAMQLDGWLLMLSNMLSATGSLGNAIRSSADLIQSPLKEEVELILKQIRVGTTIEDALANMYKRTPSRGLRTVVTSLRVGRRIGGDLPLLLSENAATLRESERIDGFIRSQVAQGKAQMLVLGVAPAFLIYMFMNITPDFFAPLLNHAIGPFVIIGCAAMWVAAIVIGLKIMNVDA
ncbi:MAG: hypothetical protein GY811_15475 [Myxococcales bacterium]|nr:hypothetical protein [Myxococcales bacterium]